MDKGSNIIKYLFIVFVLGLIAFTAYIIVHNRTESLSEAELDQTSKTSNIQTDLRLAIADFDTINPILSNNRNVQEIDKIIFESLITLDPAYEIEYLLAEKIERIDPVTYDVYLRQGVRWSDGSEFKANDVRFSVDRIKDGYSPIYGTNLKNLVGLEILDDYKIRITLDQEVPFFEYLLTFPILNEASYTDQEFNNTETNTMPLSTGKFKIAEVINNQIKLVRNDDYWNPNKLPMVKEILITKYETIGEVYNAFKSGDIDIYIVKNKNLEDYIGTIGYNRIEYKGRNYDFISINMANEILAEKSVRKALAKVIDRDTIIASVLGSGYVASNFSLDMGSFLYTRDLNSPSDHDGATQILLQDGWEYKNNTWQKVVDKKTRRLQFDLAVDSTNEERVAVAENLKEQFENFGIHINIQYLSKNNYNNAINNHSYDLILTGMKSGFTPDLDIYFGNDNLAGYYNEEVLGILEEAKGITSDRDLAEKYARILDIYEDEVPYIGLYRNTENLIMNQGLVGNITPSNYNIFYNIEKWYRQ